MEIGNIVTLSGSKKYYIIDKTTQNEKNYYLASKVEIGDNVADATEIFEETVKDNVVYLAPVKDENLFNYLSAVFIEKFNDFVEEGF